MNQADEKLIARYLNGEPLESEVTELCKSKPEALDHLVKQLSTERLLKAKLNTDVNHYFKEDVVERLKLQSGENNFTNNVIHEIKYKQHALFKVVSITALFLCSIGLAWFMNMDQGVIAQVSKVESVDWKGVALKPNDTLNHSVVEFHKGFLELEYHHGTKLVIEGPAKFELLDEMQVHLHHGKVVANVTEQGYGFKIHSPEVEVIDLGTKFGVEVDPSGKTEVHVLEGEVKAKGVWEDEYKKLVHHQASSWDKLLKQQHDLEMESSKFLEALPARAQDEETKYLYYSFDEKQGALVYADGEGYDIEEARGHILNDNSKDDFSKNRIKGVLGEALNLQASKSWIDTKFSGISGGEPRTVAFWVKSNPGERLSYAILGWGNLSEVGAVWQISLNPNEKDGLLGRIRLGLQGGKMIGNKDLRDGLWHHIAIVMYPGRADDPANLKKHVLFYVDGEIEMTTRKSFAYVDTKIDAKKSVPLRVGKTARKGAEEYFNGMLDELFIVNRSLSQEEILKLMNHDRTFLQSKLVGSVSL